MTTPKTFYVYLFRDPRPDNNLCPVYVGKGNGRRARKHLWRTHNPFLRNFISRCRKAQLEIPVEIVSCFTVEADAFALEVELIAKYGRRDLGTGTLYNLTDGGEGTAGLIVSPENAAAASLRLRTRNADPSVREAQSKLMQRLQFNPTFEDARLDGLKRYNSKPATKAANIERARQWSDDPIILAGRSENMRRLRADPVFAEKVKMTTNTPEMCEASSQRMLELHADKERSERQIRGLRRIHAERRARRDARKCADHVKCPGTM